MARALLGVLVIGVLTGSSPDSTGWLSSDRPTIRVLFERSVRTSCHTDCERYTMLLAYRGTVSPTSSEQAEWSAVSDVQCVDVVLPGRSSFACRGPGSMAGTAKNGQPYATIRFHVKRETLDDLTQRDAQLRVQSITLRLPDATRTMLATFLRNPIVAARD